MEVGTTPVYMQTRIVLTNLRTLSREDRPLISAPTRRSGGGRHVTGRLVTAVTKEEQLHLPRQVLA